MASKKKQQARAALGLDFVAPFEDPGEEVSRAEFKAEGDRQKQLFTRDILSAGFDLLRSQGETVNDQTISDAVGKFGGSPADAFKFFGSVGGDREELAQSLLPPGTLEQHRKVFPKSSAVFLSLTPKHFDDRAAASIGRQQSIAVERDLQATDLDRVRRTRLGTRSTVLTTPTGIVSTNILGGGLEL